MGETIALMKLISTKGLQVNGPPVLKSVNTHRSVKDCTPSDIVALENSYIMIVMAGADVFFIA